MSKYNYPPVNFWSVWFSEVVLRNLKKNDFEIKSGSSVLDVGCGLGNHCFALREFLPGRIVGFDISDKTIELLKEFDKNILFKKVDICEDNITEFRSGFDIVFSCDVYEHVNEPALMLKQIHYVLKDNGSAVITFPNFDDHGHNQVKALDELSQIIKDAGFADQKIEIMKDRSFIYKLFTGFYVLMQNVSDLFFGVKRKPNRMPDSDEFHEMYAYQKIMKIKNKKFLVRTINFMYDIMKKLARFSSVYTVEPDITNISNKRIVFWAKK